MGKLASSDVEFEDIIEFFMASEEFSELYGEDLSDDDFIEALYTNTLDRNSDNEGKGYWISQLASGMAREEILQAFSESEEHIQLILPDSPLDDTVL